MPENQVILPEYLNMQFCRFTSHTTIVRIFRGDRAIHSRDLGGGGGGGGGTLAPLIPGYAFSK